MILEKLMLSTKTAKAEIKKVLINLKKVLTFIDECDRLIKLSLMSDNIVQQKLKKVVDKHRLI